MYRIWVRLLHYEGWGLSPSQLFEASRLRMLLVILIIWSLMLIGVGIILPTLEHHFQLFSLVKILFLSYLVSLIWIHRWIIYRILSNRSRNKEITSYEGTCYAFYHITNSTYVYLRSNQFQQWFYLPQTFNGEMEIGDTITFLGMAEIGWMQRIVHVNSPSEL